MVIFFVIFFKLLNQAQQEELHKIRSNMRRKPREHQAKNIQGKISITKVSAIKVILM